MRALFAPIEIAPRRISTVATMAFSIAIALGMPSRAHAASGLCDLYRKDYPEFYKALCTNGRATTRPAGASSTFTSAFNLSPASLPTEPSSYGLETLLSRLRAPPHEARPTFSIVKGFNKFGTGISTGGNDTFYGDDVIERRLGTPDRMTFEPREEARGKFPNLNLGGSVEVFAPKSGPTLRAGVSLRYNHVTSTWGGGPAVTLASPYLTLGAATSQERISNTLPRVRFTNYLVSARYWLLELQYDQLRNDSPFRQGPIHILTLTATIKGLLLTVAERRLDYGPAESPLPTRQRHYAVQYLFSKAWSLGVLYNYIPGATTFGAQFFL